MALSEEDDLDEALVSSDLRRMLKEGDTVSGLPGPKWVLAVGMGTGIGFGSFSFFLDLEAPVSPKTSKSSRLLLYFRAQEKARTSWF